MRVLIVARCKNGHYAPFITEQVDAVKKQGVECEYYGVDGKGIVGYLRQIPKLRKAIRKFNPDVIHAHYGLCGLLANAQRRVPVVTTYHGSDINNPRVFRFSKRSIRLSRFNIFVSQKNVDIALPRKDFALIPCGINLDDYPVIEKSEARREMKLDMTSKYVLFAGAFDNPVKNAALALSAMERVPEAELLELKGYTRTQVALLMQAADAFLMTSLTEGSPQVIKEAMACGCPIVSVDVGDVKTRLTGLDGCYIADRSVEGIAASLRKALAFEGRTSGREAIIRDGLTDSQIAGKIMGCYAGLL
ncbi:MAG: glycosyltransferase [Bacteroidales bacterium]|nr:glycosyltransferase [Bacteroidales bacterium]